MSPSRTRLRLPLVVAAVAALSLAAGCGGSSGPSTTHVSTPVKIHTYNDQPGANLALKAGRDDAVAADFPVVGYAAKQSNGAFTTVGTPIETAPYGIAFPKNQTGLRDAVAAALQKLIDNGTYTTVLNKWGSGTAVSKSEINAVGDPTPAPTGDPKTLLPAEFKGKTLLVASDAAYAPFESFAPDHKTVVGFDPDLAAAIGKELGVTFKFVNVTFTSIIPALKAGRYHLAMSAMTDKVGREKQVDFVDYLNVGSGIMVRSSDQMGITGFNSTLCGHTVAVEKGTVEIDQLKAIKC